MLATSRISLYSIDIVDANKVKVNYIGYTVLTSSLELLKTDQNHFNPNREATYSGLAVSIIRLVYEMS